MILQPPNEIKKLKLQKNNNLELKTLIQFRTFRILQIGILIKIFDKETF